MTVRLIIGRAKVSGCRPLRSRNDAELARASAVRWRASTTWPALRYRNAPKGPIWLVSSLVEAAGSFRSSTRTYSGTETPWAAASPGKLRLSVAVPDPFTVIEATRGTSEKFRATPAAEAVAGLLRVATSPERAVRIVSSAMPWPVTTCPTIRPAVEERPRIVALPAVEVPATVNPVRMPSNSCRSIRPVPLPPSGSCKIIVTFAETLRPPESACAPRNPNRPVGTPGEATRCMVKTPETPTSWMKYRSVCGRVAWSTWKPSW
ncbi:MAG: hypothetical protein WKF75_00610 [Singulisphaera sp.]